MALLILIKISKSVLRGRNHGELLQLQKKTEKGSLR